MAISGILTVKSLQKLIPNSKEPDLYIPTMGFVTYVVASAQSKEFVRRNLGGWPFDG